MTAAWWWDTFRPDHWRFWPEWLRDWYRLRRRWTKKNLARRLAVQEAKMRELFELLAEMTRDAGMDATGVEAAKPEPERHLHLVRLAKCLPVA